MFGTKTLEEKESVFNGHLRVVKTLGMGIYIQSNGLTQSGGVVEHIWRPTLNKLGNEEIKKILILGLGGGTVAKLLRKKYPDAKIVGIEIDPIMIELGKKYLNLDKYDVDIKVKDANKLKIDIYDLIIVDMYSGYEFVDLVKFDFSKSKTVIFNRLYFGDKRPDTVRFGNKLEKIFKKVTWFYPEANVMFICEP